MLQKTTWTHYFLIGLIISLTLTMNSCAKVAYAQFGKFYFVNNTNHRITYDKGLEAFNVGPNETIIVSQIQDSGKSVIQSSYISPFLLRSNGLITIRFDNNKCLIDEKRGDPHSVMDISNYIPEKIDKRTYKFTYTFTEADYNRAVTCP